MESMSLAFPSTFQRNLPHCLLRNLANVAKCQEQKRTPFQYTFPISPTYCAPRHLTLPGRLAVQYEIHNLCVRSQRSLAVRFDILKCAHNDRDVSALRTNATNGLSKKKKNIGKSGVTFHAHDSIIFNVIHSIRATLELATTAARRT